jgi:hypothetical protein
MNYENYIQKYMNLNDNKIINNNEKNISKFLLSFIIHKESKIFQIGDIDKNAEKMILNTIETPKHYHKVNKILDFDFNKFQHNKDIIFDTLIISLFHKTYEFCINYSSLFKQINTIFFYYNGKTKLCNAVRTPFFKQNFKSLLYIPLLENKVNKGAIYKNKKINFEIFKKGNLKGEIGHFNFSHGYHKINRTSIINHLIKKYDLKTYLEIGVSDGINLNKVIIPDKIGIDPEPTSECKLIKNMFLMTSDEYFEHISNSNKKFDIIFIDGLHLEEQVTKDIQNSLKHLNDNGFIIMHDCNPPSKFHQRSEYYNNGKYTEWNGTVWYSYAKLRINEPNLKMHVINCDWGVGILQKGKQQCYPKIENLRYTNLDSDRANLLNLLSVHEFLTIY